jgi:pimeloyl-ACP methyl ester carboxylesterase
MIRRLIFALAGLLALGRAPFAACATPTSYDTQIIKPHLVDIGAARRLSLNCVGKGAPVVIFLQGGEGSILNWREVEKPIAAMTRVCFYDRAGFGWSDPPRGAITGLSETDDLHALIAKAGIPTPVVLVGHSIGGFYATMFADRFRPDVAGMVLVDPGFAGQFDPPTPAERTLEEGNIRQGDDHLRQCAALARQRRLSPRDSHDCFMVRDCSATGAHRAPEETRYLLNMCDRPFAYEAELAQSDRFFPAGDEEPEDYREERQASRSFGDMPLIVMTAGVSNRDSGQSDAIYEDFTRRWKLGHDKLAARSTRGESILVPGAHHFIQLDEPQMVIDAVAKVLSEARAHPS